MSLMVLNRVHGDKMLTRLHETPATPRRTQPCRPRPNVVPT